MRLYSPGLRNHNANISEIARLVQDRIAFADTLQIWFRHKVSAKMLAEVALEALAQSGDIRIEGDCIYPVA